MVRSEAEKSEELHPTLYRAAEKLQSVWQLTRKGGAYLREGTLRDLVKETKGQALHHGRLGYLPWRKDPDGSIRCYAEDVEWSEERLSLRVDGCHRPFICRLDETGREIQRAYIGEEAKPFAELAWEPPPEGTGARTNS
ncbi:hypothetical protein ACFQ5F_13540 [Kroppenstedtia eburnea]|uniref:hypothetical protein n=1 Tax=Kroppenstedtia eburnea TaxID=714067 RepID=UPI003634A709